MKYERHWYSSLNIRFLPNAVKIKITLTKFNMLGILLVAKNCTMIYTHRYMHDKV